MWSWRGRAVSNFLKYKRHLSPRSCMFYCENFQTPKSSKNFTVNTQMVFLHHLDSFINILLYSFHCISTHLTIHLSAHKHLIFLMHSTVACRHQDTPLNTSALRSQWKRLLVIILPHSFQVYFHMLFLR